MVPEEGFEPSQSQGTTVLQTVTTPHLRRSDKMVHEVRFELTSERV
jgi:hypothetical protein